MGNKTLIFAALWGATVLGCRRGDACALALLPDDVVVTEFVAGAVPGVWAVEVFNAAASDLPRQALRLQAVQPATAAVGAAAGVTTLAAHGYGVIADIALGTATMAVVDVRCGERMIDRVATPVPAGARAWALSGGRMPDGRQNDDPRRWCAAVPSPAVANASCTAAAAATAAAVGATAAATTTPRRPRRTAARTRAPDEPAPPRRCNDNGSRRRVRVPAPGGVRVTEVMADPRAVSDKLGEWIEVLAQADTDLIGLRVDVDDRAGVAVQGDDCRGVAAGDRVVLAASADPAANGGLAGRVLPWRLKLPNRAQTVTLRHGTAVIDQVRLDRTSSGRAWQRDPRVGAAANAGCFAEPRYGAGDRGTPGQAEPPCAGDGG